MKLKVLFLVFAYNFLAVQSDVLVRRHGNHDHGDDEEGHDHSHEHEHGHEHGHGHEHSHVDPAANCGTIKTPPYSLMLHIAALFIILGFSAVGCFFTGILSRMSWFKVPPTLINVFRHFGTGVIISTAFIHMLMEAIGKFSNKCAPRFTQEVYVSTASFIAMMSIFIVHLIETIVVSKLKATHDAECVNLEEKPANEITEHHHHHFDFERQKLSTYILELGILSHSVFIGITLGVQGDKGMWPLLIAISFHQFFEGLGLGARIADLNLNSIFKPLLMVLSYTVTTPLGIALGMGIRSFYSKNSSSSLVVQGTFEAISAGVLIYTGLVELLGRELSIDSEFGSRPWSIRILYLLALYLGAITMAIIGFWA